MFKKQPTFSDLLQNTVLLSKTKRDALLKHYEQADKKEKKRMLKSLKHYLSQEQSVIRTATERKPNLVSDLKGHLRNEKIKKIKAHEASSHNSISEAQLDVELQNL